MNTSSVDKETYDILLGALEGAREMSRQIKQKRELKRWSDISLPLTLKGALTSLSKDELSDIRRQLEIKGASQLKKGDLIELLCKEIPLSIEKMLRNMDQERFELIKKVMHSGGTLEEPTLAPQQIDYFRQFVILFSGTNEGKKLLAMPEEMIQSLNHLEKDNQLTSIFRRNTQWIKLTQGLLYYFGTLTMEELMDLLAKYTDEPIDISDYLTVMDEASTYYNQFRMEPSGFSQIRVFDPEQVKHEHQLKNNVEFFPFSKEQLLRAGEPDYIERNESYNQFVHFLTQNYEMSSQDADDLVKECVYATNIGQSLGDVVQFLQTRLALNSIDAIKACTDKVVTLMNNTKKWFLKGYSSRELSSKGQKTILPLADNKKIIDLAAKRKIGRNDPCPCGSGKKYKKCCGR